MQPGVPSGREVSHILRTVNAPAVILGLIVIVAGIITGVALLAPLEPAIKLEAIRYILGFFLIAFVITAGLTAINARGMVLTESGHLRQREIELKSRVIEVGLNRIRSEDLLHLIENDLNVRLGLPPEEETSGEEDDR